MRRALRAADERDTENAEEEVEEVDGEEDSDSVDAMVTTPRVYSEWPFALAHL